MPVNREQMSMEQSQTVDNEVYTVGDKVYYTGTGETFEDGDRLGHGKQGEVVGPATSKSYRGKGVAVLFPGNKGAINCFLTNVRHPQPCVALAALCLPARRTMMC